LEDVGAKCLRPRIPVTRVTCKYNRKCLMDRSSWRFKTNDLKTRVYIATRHSKIWIFRCSNDVTFRSCYQCTVFGIDTVGRCMQTRTPPCVFSNVRKRKRSSAVGEDLRVSKTNPSRRTASIGWERRVNNEQ